MPRIAKIRRLPVKEIDIYFITGQSNASGSTTITDAAALEADYPALVSGTMPHILYAGNASGNTPNNTVTYGWRDVKPGLGSSTSKMGPEVGMAKAFSVYYNEETGKVAGMIKFAHGATGLCNTEANNKPDAQGRYAGNWSPPSYVPHAPNDPALAYKGFLYREFIKEAHKRLAELKEMGFDKIHVKGLYWMQGCNDTWRYAIDRTWYPAAFACLVNDMRADVAKVMYEVQGDSGNAENMPVFIGTVSPAYRMGDIAAKNGDVYTDKGEYLAATRKRNDPFIAMQKQLAVDNANCHVIDNNAYPNAVYVENADGTVTYTVIGTDIAHPSQEQCYAIGQNVGNRMLEVCTTYQK